MWIRLFVFGLVSIASLCAQKRFSWQEYCFKNPSAIVCPGHDYAVKPTRPAPSEPSRDITRSRFASDTRATPAMTVLGGIDWRFADPFADALVGINFSDLAAAPLARSLIAQLGASQGLSEADTQKIFDALSTVDQVAISVRGNRMVAMLTGRVTDSLPPAQPGMKVLPVAETGILLGHPDAVDQAAWRISLKGPLNDLAQRAEAQQAGSEFWAIVSAGLAGPQLTSAGVTRFALTVSLRDRLTADMAFEFASAPAASVLRNFKVNIGSASIEGNSIHFRTSMEADEVRQKFAQIAASPVGQRLAMLVAAARSLPGRNAPAPAEVKPVIYGLDDGPRVVK